MNVNLKFLFVDVYVDVVVVVLLFNLCKVYVIGL